MSACLFFQLFVCLCHINFSARRHSLRCLSVVLVICLSLCLCHINFNACRHFFALPVKGSALVVWGTSWTTASACLGSRRARRAEGTDSAQTTRSAAPRVEGCVAVTQGTTLTPGSASGSRTFPRPVHVSSAIAVAVLKMNLDRRLGFHSTVQYNHRLCVHFHSTIQSQTLFSFQQYNTITDFFFISTVQYNRRLCFHLNSTIQSLTLCSFPRYNTITYFFISTVQYDHRLYFHFHSTIQSQTLFFFQQYNTIVDLVFIEQYNTIADLFSFPQYNTITDFVFISTVQYNRRLCFHFHSTIQSSTWFSFPQYNTIADLVFISTVQDNRRLGVHFHSTIQSQAISKRSTFDAQYSLLN